VKQMLIDLITRSDRGRSGLLCLFHELYTILDQPSRISADPHAANALTVCVTPTSGEACALPDEICPELSRKGRDGIACLDKDTRKISLFSSALFLQPHLRFAENVRGSRCKKQFSRCRCPAAGIRVDGWHWRN
jgi:hypothetical protein